MTGELKNCGYCGVKLGELHVPGCDKERCPRCGGQSIACGCIYEVCGMDRDTLEDEHPDIYAGGPTDAMYATWDAEWGSRRLPWTGRYPGSAEAEELGFFCYWDEARGWVRCGPDHPEATPDLNRLIIEGRWAPERGRWVRKAGRDA